MKLGKRQRMGQQQRGRGTVRRHSHGECQRRAGLPRNDWSTREKTEPSEYHDNSLIDRINDFDAEAKERNTREKASQL